MAHPYQTIPFDIRKSSVALFVNELVYKAIREEEANPELFEFLWKSCLKLDETNEPVSNFHLFFALQLCRHLGIFPQMNYSNQFPIFNMREGLFQSSIPEHLHYLDPGNSRRFNELLELCSLEEMRNSELAHWRNNENILSAEVRDRLLENILQYYQLHLPGFKGLQSHHVLRAVLS